MSSMRKWSRSIEDLNGETLNVVLFTVSPDAKNAPVLELTLIDNAIMLFNFVLKVFI